MNDCESEVFSNVAVPLRAQFSGIFVSGEAVAVPSSFPAVTGFEVDNSTYERTLDSSGMEKHSRVMWQWEVYSNLSSGKKSQCKAIMALVDQKMFEMGFLRVGNGPVEMPNANQSIYRMVARYRAVISKDKTIYRK